MMMDMNIQIGHALDSSEIYGPGLRAVLWVQGCTLACERMLEHTILVAIGRFYQHHRGTP